MITTDEKLALADFMVVHSLKKTAESYLIGEMGVMEAHNYIKATLQRLSPSEMALKERLASVLSQIQADKSLGVESFKSCAISVRDLLQKEYARTVKFNGLEELSLIGFSDSETFDMKLNFEEKKFSYLSDEAYFKLDEKFVFINTVKVQFVDWTDYYAVQVFSVESGKDNKVGSDFFEPIVDLPYFEIFKDKNSVVIFGSGEFVYDDFKYHFVNPKVSGTFEWEREPIP